MSEIVSMIVSILAPITLTGVAWLINTAIENGKVVAVLQSKVAVLEAHREGGLTTIAFSSEMKRLEEKIDASAKLVCLMLETINKRVETLEHA